MKWEYKGIGIVTRSEIRASGWNVYKSDRCYRDFMYIKVNGKQDELEVLFSIFNLFVYKVNESNE